MSKENLTKEQLTVLQYWALWKIKQEAWNDKYGDRNPAISQRILGAEDIMYELELGEIFNDLKSVFEEIHELGYLWVEKLDKDSFSKYVLINSANKEICDNAFFNKHLLDFHNTESVSQIIDILMLANN